MNKIEQNLEKYKKQLKALGHDKLIPMSNPPKNTNDLMNLLAKEGHSLLEQEALSKCKKMVPENPTMVLEQALGTISKNPYIRARTQVLKDLTADRRNSILKLESEGQIDDRRYTEFVKMVAILGDKFSNNP